MTAPLLNAIRIVEIAGERGAAAAGLLASLGAEVVRVGHGAGAYDLGKRPARSLSPGAIARLTSKADIIIGCDPADFRAGGRFDPGACARTGLIAVSITPFGVVGPYAGFAGPEIVVSAMGGSLGVTGYEDRPPVKEALDACGFHAEMMAAAGAMMALHAREAGGPGQHIDISVQEVAASRMTNGILAWQFDHRLLERTGVALSYGKARVRCVWDLKDGWVFHSLMTGRFGAPANAALSAWMDEAGFDNPMRGVDWIKYDRSALEPATRASWEGAIAAFFALRTRAEMQSEGRRRGINACVVNEPADVLADQHLAARGFWEQRGEVRAPGRFVRIADANGEDLDTSPDVSPFTETEIDAWPERRVRPTAGAEPGALAGLKVLDFSWALVGSITTKLLADHGADIVKVESATRPCLSRIDVQVAASKRGNFDDKPWFIHMNTGKKSLRINMKDPRSREVIDALVGWADVIVENFSPGTMKSLGLDYATLAARKPDLVMVSGSVFGQTGPLAKEWGVDGTGAALAGRLALTGWPDRTPVTPSSVPYGDVVLPPVMAAATVAAIHHRRRTGKGAHVDASMYETCVQQMAPAILDAQSGQKPVRTGNADPAAELQGVYPARGGLIALRVADKAELERLGNLVGGDASEARLGSWLNARDPWEAMAELQSAGIAAGVVQTAADLVDRDPQLRARSFIVDLDNPALGRFAHQASPIHLSGSPATLRTAPGLGEHTDEICSRIAELDQGRIAELRAGGVFE